MRTPLYFAAVALLFCGCRYFAPDIRLKREVGPQEVVGLWVLREHSLVIAKKDASSAYSEPSSRNHDIAIFADGTCRFRSIRQMPTRYLDCDGTWTMGRALDDKNIRRIDLHLNQSGGYGFSLDCTEEEGRLVLWEYWGDPDSWELLKYDRKSEAAHQAATASL